MLAAQVSNARPGAGPAARRAPSQTTPPGPGTPAPPWTPAPRPGSSASRHLPSPEAGSTWSRGRRPHSPDPSFLAFLLQKVSGAVRAGAPKSDFSCSLLSALGELSEPKGECLCLVLRNPLCSAVGTVSHFLKNYFNKVRQLPRWGRKGSGGWGRGETPRACPGSAPRRGSEAPEAGSPPAEAGARRRAEDGAGVGRAGAWPGRPAAPCVPVRAALAAASSPASACGFPSRSRPRLQPHQ